MKIPDKIKLPNNVKNKGNGSFEIRVTVGGQRKSKYVRPIEGMTKRQIEDFLTQEKAKYFAELTGDYSTPLPFGEVLDMYLDSTSTRIRDTSRTSYKGQAPRIKEKLGHIKINKLNRILMQEFIDELPIGSQENNKYILVNVFNFAKEYRMVDNNPAERVEFKTIDKEKEFHTREEIGQILTALAEYKNSRIGAYAVAQLRLFVELAVHSGMRIGELTGLMWSDIDFDKWTVHIHQQLIYDCKDKRKLYISDATKNGKSRTINIPQRIIDLLVEYKEHQQQEFKRNKWTKNANMVFTDYRTDGLIPKSAPNDWFASFCKKYKFRHLSPHSFRHFYATMTYAVTKDPALVAEQIGDEIATVIKYYVHAESDSKEKACQAITGVIERAIENIGVTLGYEPEIESLKVAV